MRKNLINLLLIIPVLTNSQIFIKKDTGQIKITENFTVKTDLWYLDSLPIKTTRLYLNPHNVKNIRVFKEADLLGTNSGQALFITRYKKDSIVSLSSFKTVSSNNDSSLYKFIIDGELIKDTTGILIETSTVKTVNIYKNWKSTLYHGHVPPTTFFLITTNTKDKIKKRNRN